MIGLKMKKSSLLFEDYLDELYTNPRCELNYSKDYELLIAVVLSAQTTDKAVNKVTEVLFNKYPTLEDLNNADIEDISKILRPIGTFNRKASYIKEISKRLLEECNGIVPKNSKYLESLPGVGHKTSNVVLSNLFDYPAIAVDTHVERVSKRLGLVKKKATVREVEKGLEKLFDISTWSKRHHQMVLFGRYHCKAVKPDCENCKISEICLESKIEKYK